MATFTGDYPCRIDSKGRVVIPAAFIRHLSQDAQNRFVAQKDIFEKCLILYPMDEWEAHVRYIKENTNPYNKEHNKLLDYLFMGTAESALDNSNRVLIPKRLLDKCGIGQDVILAGQGNVIKVWDKTSYEGKESEDIDIGALAQKILGKPKGDG